MWAPCTGTSPSGSTSSKPSTATTWTCWSVRSTGGWPSWARGPALEAWLRAYVDYGRAKRTFLNELHEAFEKNPDLKPASRDRIWAACNRVLGRAQEAGQARSDIDGQDLMQLISPMCMNSTLSVEQGERLLAMVLDGLRPSSPPAAQS